MDKIAVLGDRDSVLGFRLLGAAVFPAETAEEARRMMAEGVPPFGEANDRQGEPDEGPIEIRLYAKSGRRTKTMIRRVRLDHAEEIFKAVRIRKPRA